MDAKIKLNPSTFKKIQNQFQFVPNESSMPVLTKDADKMICCLYKEYLVRRSHNIAKRNANRFSDEYFKSDEVLSKWLPSDLIDTKNELGQKGYLNVFISDEFVFNDNSVIYMENRFKNGLSEVIDLVSKFIP